MAHIIRKARLRYASWITGAPGCGYNTVGELLKGFMTDNVGFRNDHKLPNQWFISNQVLKYKITEPDNDQPYYYGFGQNFMEIAELPWKHIYFIKCSEETLVERIMKYRLANRINDGKPHEDRVLSLLNLQTRIEKEFNAYSIPFKLIDGNKTPSEIVSEIKNTN